MKGIRSLFAAGAAILLILLGLSGCSGGGQSLATGPATVRLVLANSRAVLPTDFSSLVFTQIDLLSGTANPTAPSVLDWSLTAGLINPDFPIPLLGSPSTIPSYNGENPDAGQVLSAVIPPGTYQTIRVEVDQAFAGVLNDLGLPFQPATLQALIPIVGGMSVNPNESITLLVDLATHQAQVL